MPQSPFEDRWELSPSQQDHVRAVKEALGELARAKAGIAAVEAALHARAQEIALDILNSIPGAPSKYAVPIRSMAADLAAVQHVSDTTMRNRMEDATAMIERFPATFTALCEMGISAAHAAVVCDEGERLADDEVRARYEGIALQFADTTPAKLRPICQAVAERLEPQTISERHEQANERRGMWLTPERDGMALIELLVDAALAEGIDDRTMAIAREVKSGLSEEDEDPRTLAQIRADVVTDMLLTAAPTAHGDGLDAIRAVVHVTIPAEVIAGADDRAAHSPRVGVMAPSTARCLAGKTYTWARLFQDPKTGALTAVDSYVPTAEQRRFLTARDEHCRFPGCRRPVYRCDLDHTVPYSEGGATHVDNLGALCRAHHVLKHNSAWSARNLGRGLYEWTSPTGQVLDESPQSAVRFMALAAADEAAGADPPPF
ncbi:HNH endonuclease signature motif containing protein [Microbacterium paludicola]|uniref:HNH endonuclease signature motif containing protein n=1 Tax=Microbacterium paludicola TaxID=300019 RepID=UPI0031CE18B9